MSRKALTWTTGVAALAVAGFYGYRALGGWLVAAMTGKVKAPLSGPTAAEIPPQAATQAPQQAAVSPTHSGLDLIQKSGEAREMPDHGNSLAFQAQAQTVKQASLNLIDSLKPLLSNPALTSRLSPAQARQYRQLMAILASTEKAAKSDGPLDMRQMAAQVRKAQQLSLSLMSQLPQAPAQTREGQTPR